MTPEELKLLRLQIHVLFLERLLLNGALVSLMSSGATLQEAQKELTDALEGDVEMVSAQLRSRPYSPSEFGLLHDETREIVDEMKALIRSYQ